MKNRTLFRALSIALLFSTILGFTSCFFGPVQPIKEVSLPKEGYLIAYQGLTPNEDSGRLATWLYGIDAKGNIRYEDNQIGTDGMITTLLFLRSDDGTYREFSHEGFWKEQNPDSYLTKGMIETKLYEKLYNINLKIYRATTAYGGITKKTKDEDLTIAGVACESYTITSTTQKSGANYKVKNVYKIAFDPATGVCLRYEHVSTQRVNIDSEPTAVGSGYICTEFTLNPSSFDSLIAGS